MALTISEVYISNLALGWLGQAPIVSLDDPQQAAGLCKVNYPVLRDAVLEEGEWQFAFKQTSFAPVANILPAVGDGKYFLYPADCIRLLRADDGSQTFRLPWRREGRFIRASSDVLYADYIERVEDPSRFTPGFVQALAARMAAELAMPITNSADMFKTMWQLYTAKIRQALNLDGMQGQRQRVRSDELIRVR